MTGTFLEHYTCVTRTLSRTVGPGRAAPRIITREWRPISTRMSKNGIVLSILLVALGGAYAVWFTDWFRSESLQIVAVPRPAAGKPRRIDPNQPPVHPVSFTFNRKCELTSLKVLAAEDFATNKFPVALWHLVSESNSVPTRSFLYGQPIKGMHSAVARMRPEPLVAGVKYILQVEAGKVHGEVGFITSEVALPQ